MMSTARVSGGILAFAVFALVWSAPHIASAQILAFAPDQVCALSRSPFLPIASMPNDPCPYDQDGNGLDDDVEMEIAKCIVPEMRFDSEENALVPGAEPAMVFSAYRVGVNTVQVFMTGFFQNDGGFAASRLSGDAAGDAVLIAKELACLGTDAHTGDTMPVNVTANIVKGYNGWYVYPVGVELNFQPAEVAFSRDGTHPIFYPSAGKHHQHSHTGTDRFGCCCSDGADGLGYHVIPGQNSDALLPGTITSPLAHAPSQLGSYISIDVESTRFLPDDSNVCVLERSTGDSFEIAQPVVVEDFVNVCALGRAGPGPALEGDFVLPLSATFQGPDLGNLGFPNQSLFVFHLESPEVDHRPFDEIHRDAKTLTPNYADLDGDGQPEIYTFDPPVVVPNSFELNACTLAIQGQFIPPASRAPTDLCPNDSDKADADGDRLAGSCDPNPFFRNAYVAGGGPAPYLAYSRNPTRFPQAKRGESVPWSFNGPRGGFMDRDQDGLVEGEDLCPSVYAGTANALNPDTNYWGEQTDFSSVPDVANLGEFYRGDVCDPYPATTTTWLDSGQAQSAPPTGCGQIVIPSGGGNEYRVHATVSAFRSANDPGIGVASGTKIPTEPLTTYRGQAYRCACANDGCLNDPSSPCFAPDVARADETKAGGRGWLPMQRSGCTLDENGFCVEFTLPNVSDQTLSWSWLDEANQHPDHFIAGDISRTLPTGGTYLLPPLAHSNGHYVASVRVQEGESFTSAPGASLVTQDPFPEPEQTTAGGALLVTTSTESRRLRASFDTPVGLASPFSGVPLFGPLCAIPTLPRACLTCALRFDPRWVEVPQFVDPLRLLKPTVAPWVYNANAGSFTTSTFLQPQARVGLKTALEDVSSWVAQVVGTAAAMAPRAPNAESTPAVAPNVLFVERTPASARWALLDAASVVADTIKFATQVEGSVGTPVSDTAAVLTDPRSGVAAILDRENRAITGFDPVLRQWVRVLPALPELYARNAPAVALSGSTLFVIGGGANEAVASDGWMVDVLTGTVVPTDFGLPAREGAMLTPAADGSSLLFVGGVDRLQRIHDDVWALPLADPRKVVAEQILLDSSRAAAFDPNVVLYGSPSDGSFIAWSVGSDGTVVEEQRDERGWHASQCPSGDLKTYGLFASNRLDLDPNVTVLTDSGFGTIASGGLEHTDIGSGTEVGSVVSKGDVVLESHAAVHGSVVTSGTFAVRPRASVSGTVTEHAPFALGDVACAMVDAPAGGRNVIIERRHPLTLNPGTYRYVSLEPGSELRLSTGTYFFDSLKADSDSTVRIDATSGPVRVYVRSFLGLKGSIQDIAGHPERILFVYAGSTPVVVERAFRGTLVAPRATLRVALCGRDTQVGAFFAKNLDVEPGTSIRAVPFTDSWLP